MSDKPKSQNDEAWEALFARYDILNQIDSKGKFIISADRIKEYREPRLMAKIDCSMDRPRVFIKNNLAILPVTRGNYVISDFKAYQSLEAQAPRIAQVSLPDHIQSLDATRIPSETIAINCALASGMLADFLEEEQLIPTVSGRMGSGRFAFNIQNITKGNTRIEINNSQVEIDAAFEGIGSLALLEAKRDVSSDFLIRQLYYPYRLWKDKTKISKKTRPVFLVYSNGVFNLYEYEFQDIESYNSLALVKHGRYSMEDTAMELPDLLSLLDCTGIQNEPEIPFPQADDFHRIINICELLLSQELTQEDVTEEYAFASRQTNYYTDAARYLGLLEKQHREGNPIYVLSKHGRRIMGLSYKRRQLELCRCILRHKVFAETFRFCQAGEIPSREKIIGIMIKSDLHKMKSESTYKRRASTVSSWIRWMVGLTR